MVNALVTKETAQWEDDEVFIQNTNLARLFSISRLNRQPVRLDNARMIKKLLEMHCGIVSVEGSPG